MQAEVIDIRIPGSATSRFRDVALALSRGGVGYYAKSIFVHVNVGRVRRRVITLHLAAREKIRPAPRRGPDIHLPANDLN